MDKNKTLLVLVGLGVLLLLAGCNNLEEQPRYHKPYDESELFDTAARPLEPNAVARGDLNENTALAYGTVNDQYVMANPLDVDAEVLTYGQRMYEGFCSPCHGYAGYGDGVIAREGFQNIRSFHIERLQEAEDGYFFDVISNGFGNMYNYAARLEVYDRWAVVAYIRALQLSQTADVNDLPESITARIDSQGELVPIPADPVQTGDRVPREPGSDELLLPQTYDENNPNYSTSGMGAGMGSADTIEAPAETDAEDQTQVDAESETNGS
jgi:mono/diheme cytochrome c family protein